jgi:hypothetical protein
MRKIQVIDSANFKYLFKKRWISRSIAFFIVKHDGLRVDRLYNRLLKF